MDLKGGCLTAWLGYTGRSSREGNALTEPEIVRQTLQDQGIHLQWKKKFRGAANRAFNELMFRYVFERIPPAVDTTVLDAGCGDARYSIRLAERGYKVVAVDFSDYIVRAAKENVRESGFGNLVEVQQSDLTNLPFEPGRFSVIFCAGVLMHIPRFELAISELARVLSPGGILVVGETNMFSADLMARRAFNSVLGRKKVKFKYADGCIESWFDTPSGPLLTRSHHIPSLIKRFAAAGLDLVDRRSGEFTEAYTKLDSAILQNAVHLFNRLWFRFIDIPGLACGQILIMKKRD